MAILRILGTAFLFLLVRQFLKLLVNANQRQSLEPDRTKSDSKDIIDTTFIRKD